MSPIQTTSPEERDLESRKSRQLWKEYKKRVSRGEYKPGDEYEGQEFLGYYLEEMRLKREREKK